MAEVYGLYSGRDGRVRYVGQTVGPCKDRFEEHKRSSWKLRKWFRNEWTAGYPIECVLLQSCDNEVRFRVELDWMARFPDLLNERISAQTWLTAACGKPPKVPKIIDHMRRYYFNVGGFRGVHYDRRAHYYFVLTCTGEWLLGHEMPDWGGNIWFADPTAALNARDRDRQCRRL
jgi:hypothetical protein